MQTETVLRQALGERIKPVMTVNKLDRAFLELQLPSEDMYVAFVKHCENVNVLIATYHDEALGEAMVDPMKGTVAFSAGLHGWAFTLTKFARMYAKKFGVDLDKMMGRLWGDNYFNAKDRRSPPGSSARPPFPRRPPRLDALWAYQLHPEDEEVASRRRRARSSAVFCLMPISKFKNAMDDNSTAARRCSARSASR